MSDAAGTAATGAATTTAAGDQGAAGAGDQGAAGTTTTTAAQAGAGQTTTTDTTQAGAQGQQQAGQQAAGADGLDWSTVPAEFRQAFEDQHNRNHRLQQENGTQRIEAKAKARDEGAVNALRDLAKSMGIELPGDEVTVEQVQGELQTVTTARDEAARASAVTDAAWEHDVDRAKRPYVEFLLSKDKALPSPSDPEFSGKVNAAVAALVAADPTLRRSGTVAAAGVENHGGANGNDNISPEQFASMTLGQKSELFRTDPDTYNRLTGRA